MELFWLLLVGSLIVMVWFVPTNRWTFAHGDHWIDVRNYGTTETIAVDGVIVATRRSGSFWDMKVEHSVDVDGERLRIEVDGSGGGMRCRAAAGQTMVFDSSGFVDVLPPPDPPERELSLRARLPPPSASRSATQVVALDPRVAAAEVLLTELASHDDEEVREANEALRSAVHAAFGRLHRAKSAAAAHTLLGGEAHDDVLAVAEAKVVEALASLRALHLAAKRVEATQRDAMPEVSAVTGRLEAEREVNEALAAKRQAARKKQPGG